MIPAGELASMQAEQHNSLDLTCTISRYSRGPKDSVGGNTETWTPDGTTTKLRIGVPKGEELQIEAKQMDTQHPTHIGTFAEGATAENPAPQRHDKLLSVSDGHTYDVLAVEDSPSYSTAQRVQLKRVT